MDVLFGIHVDVRPAFGARMFDGHVGTSPVKRHKQNLRNPGPTPPMFNMTSSVGRIPKKGRGNE